MKDTLNNITHTRGDTFVRNLTFKDSAGVAINLTGSTIVFTVRYKIEDAVAKITQTAVLTDPTAGKATITVTAATMAALAIGEYYYDIQMTDSLGAVTTPVKGMFYLTFDVTHA